jgi:4-hydroxy-tetrahydrodipicolinate reductase
MIRVSVIGSKGRMGLALQAAAAESPEVEIAAAVDQGDDLAAAIAAGDVALDFSSHQVTTAVAESCARHRKGLVIGTTGHTEAEKSQISNLKSHIPMVWSSNFSTGVNALFWLTRKAAEILGPDYDLEIIEMHHRLKQDAPSGTASTLAEILARVRGRQPREVVRHGRQGITGERGGAEIGMHAVRGGDVVGDHTVLFAGAGERVELVHKASSRETFAHGALRAASWVAGRSPGIYSMEDVLGLV